MPELPEVETVRLGLERHLLGRKISSVELRRSDLRFPFPSNFETSLNGRVVESVERRAKYLLIRLDGGMTWLCHLGMSGRWTLIGDGVVGRPGKFSSGAPLGSGDGPHDWVVIHLDSGTKAVYSDHRRFGFMDCFPTSQQEKNKLLSDLGPEPTPDQLVPQDLAEGLRGRKMPIKSALLDQRIIAGLGNIYVCESLHRAGISPRREAGGLVRKNGAPTKRLEVLVGHIKDVIDEAIEAGGSTLNDFASVDGTLGYFAHQFAVYGREGQPCEKSGCGGVVRRIVQSNRSTFFCPTCQR